MTVIILFELSLGLQDSETQISKFEILKPALFLQTQDSETLICNVEILRLPQICQDTFYIPLPLETIFGEIIHV